MLAIDEALPQRADQMQKAGGFDDGPAVGFEFCGGFVGHLVASGSACGHVV